MNFEKLDKILIGSIEEVNSLFQWRDNNKDLVREFKPTLKEGVIEYQNVREYFKREDNRIDYKIWYGEQPVLEFTIELVEQGYRIVQSKHWLKDEKDEVSFQQDAVTLHTSLMAYMAHYQRHITQRRERTTKVKKGKSGGSQKKRVIKIGRVVYDVKVPTEVHTEKRNYTPAAEPFVVKGHPRTYKKSGKTVWIEPYTKGDKTKEKSPKTYKL